MTNRYRKGDRSIMLNPVKGELELKGNKFIIRKGLTKQEFEKTCLFDEVLNQQSYGFTCYYLKPQLIGDELFIIVLYFNPRNVLDFINLSLADGDGVPSWNDWSESEEKGKKEKHDEWLLRNIGKPPYKFAWGEISSNYDPRSGSSIITIKYNE